MSVNKRRRNWTFVATIFALVLNSSAEFIIDGTVARSGEYPAVFALKLAPLPRDADGTYDNGTICTAFLVHPRLLLTAAHCLIENGGIDTAMNGVDYQNGREVRSKHYAPHPDYVKSKKATADIGYIVLREDTPKIIPLEVIPTTDDASRAKWLLKDVTVVGYGANHWRESGVYGIAAGAGTKRIGTKQISIIQNGLIYLNGEVNGVLPGDSGGPLLLSEGGTLKVIALNHTKIDSTRLAGRKHDRVEPKGYSGAVETPLTVSNLCWVEKDSGIQIPGVVCP